LTFGLRQTVVEMPRTPTRKYGSFRLGATSGARGNTYLVVLKLRVNPGGVGISCGMRAPLDRNGRSNEVALTFRCWRSVFHTNSGVSDTT